MRLSKIDLLNTGIAAAALIGLCFEHPVHAGASTRSSVHHAGTSSKSSVQQAAPRSRSRVLAMKPSVITLKPQVAKMGKMPAKRRARIARLEGAAIHHEELHIPMCGYWPSKEQLKFRALSAASAIDPSVPLKAKVTTLADGTKLDALKDDALFDADLKRRIPGTAPADLTNGYVNNTVLKAFAKMDCLEYAALGANSYTATDNFKPLSFGGKNIVSGATAEKDGPILNLTIGGRIYYINMTLPGLQPTSHNVVVVSNGEKVLAIDPRTDDTWQLHMRLPYHQYFSWSKLTHTRGLKIEPSKGGV